MSIVNIRNVEFLNNPARFNDPYLFRVTFECIAPLKDDLEWKLIYVSSPDKEELDQELDDCMVGPVPVGVNSFEFEGAPPAPNRIPPEDVLGVAAIILTASYRDQEFVRVGYYQNTEYDVEEWREKPPEGPIRWERLVRSLAEKPRVTRFSIKWDTDAIVQQPVAMPAPMPAPAPTSSFYNPMPAPTAYASTSAPPGMSYGVQHSFSAPTVQQPGAPVPPAGSY